MGIGQAQGPLAIHLSHGSDVDAVDRPLGGFHILQPPHFDQKLPCRSRGGVLFQYSAQEAYSRNILPSFLRHSSELIGKGDESRGRRSDSATHIPNTYFHVG